MATNLNQLRVEQVDGALEPYRKVGGMSVPAGGWLRAVREALGLTVRQQAARVGIAVATLHKSEQSEAHERISLAQLRKLAEGLDCELVYGLVPRKPLAEMVQEQASRIARSEILGVAHSMDLEDQRPSEAYVRRQLDQRRAELLSGKWSSLWR
ncbi:mobile mystery protein A [Variovorax paradoxus]|uniref:mobile mystery protein A n=1 Tax=Variovorax paradoxus TaxID=34073 RepID=UPI00278276F1|nr:mobile mystery protein A [Variovorax paradoxus]MDQ0590712.1 putative DNA-binding mobile mystery protein A [Variovorax paradoxus]